MRQGNIALIHSAPTGESLRCQAKRAIPHLLPAFHRWPKSGSQTRTDQWWTLFFASFPLALTAAVVSWHVIEYPVLKLRKRFSFAINHRPGDGAPS